MCRPCVNKALKEGGGRGGGKEERKKGKSGKRIETHCACTVSVGQEKARERIGNNSRAKRDRCEVRWKKGAHSPACQ
jgi:hypothetical protein